MRKVYIGVVTLMSLGIKTSKKSDIKKTLNFLKNKKNSRKIFEFSRGERFLEIYAESSSEILGIKIDFWLTPLVFLNLFMVFQKAKNRRGPPTCITFCALYEASLRIQKIVQINA